MKYPQRAAKTHTPHWKNTKRISKKEKSDLIAVLRWYYSRVSL